MAHQVYWATVKQMLKTAEPGFSIDLGANKHETLRNACTEVTSADDSDICNLGSINMSRITSLEDMRNVVELATAFLLAGTVYSDVPYAKVDQIRTKNRRLGLGLMGLHEWLLINGKPYGPDEELAKYMAIYTESTKIAGVYADAWDLSHPVKTRAIAPTGTIGIIAETTTGIEPVFCVAYKRRYMKGNTWNYQYVIDPTAKRLIDSGVAPESIEDAYVLAENVERRVEFQTWMQKYVDHSISSTINLPEWGSELNNDSNVKTFGNMLMKHLPHLRGVTCYPDGARGGQPLSTVSYKTAIKHVGEVFIEAADVCDISKGGSCGS
jgi:ribonucleoside-diphosphate reductase alpha chain